jgi:tetratricopeptide (TPR) repeat protein
MKDLHNKRWLLLSVVVVVTGAFLLLLTGLVSRQEAREPARAAAMGSLEVPEVPDHELKALAVELEKKPGHTPILMRMAQLEEGKGKLEDAERHLREVLKNEQANPDARLDLGRILYQRGDLGGAIAETEKVLAADPKQVDALYNMGAIYANVGNSVRARSYWTRAVAAGGDTESGRKSRDALTKLGGG